MDVLYRRYAHPFSFMDGMIQTGRFCEFVLEVVNLKNEDDKWQIYLHKVWDKSWNEFNEMIKVEQDNKNMSESQIETTINYSKNILANFNPEERGE